MASDGLLSEEEIQRFFFGKTSPTGSSGRSAGSLKGTVSAGVVACDRHSSVMLRGRPDSAPAPKPLPVVAKSKTKPLYWTKCSPLFEWVAPNPAKHSEHEQRLLRLLAAQPAPVTVWQQLLSRWYTEYYDHYHKQPRLSASSVAAVKRLHDNPQFMTDIVERARLPSVVSACLEAWFLQAASAPGPKAAAGAKPAGSSKPDKAGPPKKLSIVDSKRAQNVLIVLGRIRKSPLELKRIILQLQPKQCTAEFTANLRNILPTDEEINGPMVALVAQLKQMEQQQRSEGRGDGASDQEGFELWMVDHVDVPTSFLYLTSTIAHVHKRLRCHEQIFHFASQLTALQSSFSLIQSACDEIVASKPAIEGIFGLILAIGNAMNLGNKSFGQAQAFPMEFLLKLATVKCTAAPAPSGGVEVHVDDATEKGAAVQLPLANWDKLKPLQSNSLSLLHFVAMALTYCDEEGVRQYLETVRVTLQQGGQQTSEASEDDSCLESKTDEALAPHAHTILTAALLEVSDGRQDGCHCVSIRRRWLSDLALHWRAVWAVPELSLKQLLADLSQLEELVKTCEEELAWCRKQAGGATSAAAGEAASPQKSPQKSPGAKTRAVTFADDDAAPDAASHVADGYGVRLETFLSEAKPFLLRVKAQVQAIEANVARVLAEFNESYFARGESASEGT